MKKVLLTLTALASLTIVNITYAANISPATFNWDHWRIDIKSVSYSEKVQGIIFPKTADEGSTFVVVRMTVTNIDSQSHPFAPSLKAKVILNGGKYDIDESDSCLDQIEPQITKTRDFYAEIPASKKGEPLQIAFKDDGFFGIGATAEADVAVTPVAEATPAPTPGTIVDSQPDAIIVPEPTPVVEAAPMPRPVNEPSNAEAYRQADKKLNAAWNALPQKLRNFYRQDERNWIRYRDSLPTLAERTAAIRLQTNYLRHLLSSSLGQG
jgi:hypothetical protein